MCVNYPIKTYLAKNAQVCLHVCELLTKAIIINQRWFIICLY